MSKPKPQNIEMTRTSVQEPKPDTELLTKVPQLFNVLLQNDDYTPRAFVVDVLHRFFSLDEAAAHATMLTAHTKGIASCGTFPRDLAETKVKDVQDYISPFELPLRFTAEPV